MPRAEFVENGLLTVSDVARALSLVSGRDVSTAWVHQAVERLSLETREVRVLVIREQQIRAIAREDFSRLLELVREKST